MRESLGTRPLWSVERVQLWSEPSRAITIVNFSSLRQHPREGRAVESLKKVRTPNRGWPLRSDVRTRQGAGHSPLLLLSSTRMISLSRCGGVRSMAEWMERSSTESASLTKMNTMLTSGRLLGNERLRHLEGRAARHLDLPLTWLGSPQVLARPRLGSSFAGGLGSPDSSQGLFLDILKISPKCTADRPSTTETSLPHYRV